MDPARQPGIQIDRIFIERVRFEHGELARQAPLGSAVPELRFDITFEARRVEGSAKRVAGIVKLATESVDPFFYHIEIELVAVVSSIPGQENMPVEKYAMAPLVAALYPFAREAVASISSRGRHGPAYLKPFNFVAAEKSWGEEAPATRRAETRPRKTAVRKK